MPRHGPVGNFRRSLADHGHVRDLAGVLRSRAPGTPDGAAGAQMLMQITTQVTPAAPIKRLVDGFRADSHFLPIGKHRGQMITDLFRTPFQAQLFLHQKGQFRMVEFAGLGSTAAELGLLLRRIRGIPCLCLQASLGPASSQLSTDRGSRPAHQSSDRPHARAT